MGGYFTRRGGVWVIGQAILMGVVFGGGAWWNKHWESGVATIAGVLFLAIGAACGICGAVALGRSLSPFPEPIAGGKLVTTGIYALMRHPLYTAVFCGALGWALVFASWPAVVAAALLVPLFDAKARVEERRMRLRFSDYLEYEQRVKRFIPGIY